MIVVIIVVFTLHVAKSLPAILSMLLHCCYFAHIQKPSWISADVRIGSVEHATSAVSEGDGTPSSYRFRLIVAVARSFDPFVIQHLLEWNDVVNPDLSKVGTDKCW